MTTDPSARYVAGVDWGRKQDFTVIVVIDVEAGRVVDIDRFNEIGWSIQRARLATMRDRWQPTVILAEENSIGDPNIEQLQAEGLPVTPFTTTSQSKSEVIQALVLAFERGEIGIPDDPVLVGELEAFEQHRLASGRYTYGAPSGMHDDTVIALALAWWQAQGTFEQAGDIAYAQPVRFSASPY